MGAPVSVPLVNSLWYRGSVQYLLYIIFKVVCALLRLFISIKSTADVIG